MTWLPYIAYGVNAAVSHKYLLSRIARAIGAGMGLSLTIFAGHVHATVLGIMVCAVMALAAISSIDGSLSLGIKVFTKRSLLAIFIIGSVVLTITCPQLIATSEYFKLAYKWYGSGFSQFPHTVPIDVFISSSIHVSDLSTLFSGKRVSAVDYGTLFITRVGFLLGVLAVVAMMKENSTHKKVVVAALGVCAFGLSFAFSKFICFSYVYSHMPILNLVRLPTRGLFAFAFGGSILAAVGIDTLRLFVSKRVGGLPKNKANLVIIFLTIGLLFLMLVEVRYWVVERVERPLSGINSAFESTVEKVTVKELLKVSKSELPIYRYFAEREVVPPNIGNYYPLLSTHGFRSSRTIAYHKYFDFNPVSEKMDELGVRWWVTDRTLQGLSLIASFGKYFLYERPNTLPIFWIATPGGDTQFPTFKVSSGSQMRLGSNSQHLLWVN